MSRWEAIAEIVKSFNRSRRPGYALGALIIMLVIWMVPVAIAILAGVNFIHAGH